MANAATGPPVAPRLPAVLDRIDLADLEDQASWTGREVFGVFAGSAADVQVSESRCVTARLSAAELDRFRLSDAVLEDCDLAGVTALDAAMSRVEFVNCRLSGAVLAGTRLRDVTFSGCKIDGSNLRMAQLERVVFDQTILIEADLYAATLSSVRFRDCDLTAAEFSKAALTDVAFNRSRLDDVRGAESLRGVTIDPGQIVPLALSLFAALDIRVDDDRD